MNTLPSVFVSHGSPMLPVEDIPARDFLSGLGRQLGRPRAVLVVSAHWETAAPMLTGAAAPPTIHDFRGFPGFMYEWRYPAPGAPEVAEQAAERLRAAGFAARIDPARGLDHGAWVPLMLMYPGADIPTLQLSIDMAAGPDHHRRLGEALRDLRGLGVLILASGSLTHNLRELGGHHPGQPPPGWVVDFADWVAEAVEHGRDADLLTYRERAPAAVRNHPTDDHFLPLFAALGAGTPGMPGRRIHNSFAHGILAMDAYAFD